MGAVEGKTWFEHLAADECWSLVAGAAVGRIGVLVDGRPEVFPVNHGIHGHSVVFRTDPGTKLDGIDRMPWVCFEVDGFDEDRTVGWSVLLKGCAEEVGDPGVIAELEALDIRFWGVGEKTHWVRIEPEAVTGRRIGHGPGDP